MKTEARFICEKCGNTDSDVNKIMECEAKHQFFEKAAVSSYGRGAQYPDSLLVDFPDGSQWTYSRSHQFGPVREPRKMPK